MKILIVSQHYYPEQFQINEIAPALVQRGHDVTVLTGVPNYPGGETYSGYERGQKRREILDGVNVVRASEHPRKHDPINLYWNYLSYAFHASRMAKRLPPDFDVVLSYQLSPITMLKPAVVYAKKNRKPLVCYCLDIWPESAKDHMPIPFVYRWIGAYSAKLYSACDHIAVTSKPFIDYLSRVDGFDPARMSYIPQHADRSMIEADLTAQDNGVVDFMYAGNFGKGQTLQVIVRAVAELKDRDGFLVHMVGDGSRRAELEALTRELGVQDKIVFHGNQSRSDMPAFYKSADALLITLRGNNEVGNTMPGKLQMYMTAGKPIFGAINGAANDVIRESGCGACVCAGDYQGLAAIMADYMDHPERYRDCGTRARSYFMENFTFEKYVDSLESLLKSVRSAF